MSQIKNSTHLIDVPARGGHPSESWCYPTLLFAPSSLSCHSLFPFPFPLVFHYSQHFLSFSLITSFLYIVLISLLHIVSRFYRTFLPNSIFFFLSLPFPSHFVIICFSFSLWKHGWVFLIAVFFLLIFSFFFFSSSFFPCTTCFHLCFFPFRYLLPFQSVMLLSPLPLIIAYPPRPLFPLFFPLWPERGCCCHQVSSLRYPVSLCLQRPLWTSSPAFV